MSFCMIIQGDRCTSCYRKLQSKREDPGIYDLRFSKFRRANPAWAERFLFPTKQGLCNFLTSPKHLRCL